METLLHVPRALQSVSEEALQFSNIFIQGLGDTVQLGCYFNQIYKLIRVSEMTFAPLLDLSGYENSCPWY